MSCFFFITNEAVLKQKLAVFRTDLDPWLGFWPCLGTKEAVLKQK